MLARAASLALALTLAGLGQSASGPAGLQGGDLTPLASSMAALATPANGAVWAGGAGGLWRRQGLGWQSASDGQPVSAVASSGDGSEVLAGTGEVNQQPTRAGTGVWRSGDGGATWTLAGGALAGLAVTRLAVEAGSPQHVLAATVAAADSPAGAAPGLYASQDGGASWTLVLAGGVWDVGWSGTSVVAIGAGAVEVSSDDGATFAAARASGLPSAWLRGAICTAAGGGYWALFAGTAAGGGASLVQLAGDGATATAVALPAGAGLSAAALALGSDAQGDLWVGGADLWELPAATAQWSDVSAGSKIHAGQHAVAIAPDGSLWLANDGGVWQEPAGQTPTNRNAGLDNAAPEALALTAGGVVAGMAGGGLATGGDGSGSVWTVAAGPGGGGANYGALTADGGDATGESVFAAAGSQLWHSADGGQTWAAEAGAPAGAGTITALAEGAGELWVGTSSGALLASSDGGRSLGAVAAPAGAGAIRALAGAGATVWLAAAGGCYVSGDGGTTWTAVGVAGGPGGGLAALAVDGQRPAVVAAATSAGGVEISLDGGGHWVGMGSGSGMGGAPVVGLEFDGSETLWLATLGRGLWKLPLAGDGITLTLGAEPASASLGSTVNLQAQAMELGQPLAGVVVSFSAGGALAGWSATAATDAQGQAAASATLANTAGLVVFAASGDGATASASVAAMPGPAAKITVVSGANQAQVEGQELSEPIVLEVADGYGNPIANATLALSASAGSLSAASATTDSQGEATVGYTLPGASGTATLTASAGGLSQSWSEMALPAPDYALALTGPSAGVAPNQTVELTLAMSGISGYSQAVTVGCLAPATGCSVTPTSLAPGQTAVVAVAVGAVEPNQASVEVEVEADAGHRASATVELQAFTLAADASSVSVQAGAGAATVGLQAVPLHGLTGAIALTATMADGSALPATLAPLFQPSGLAFGAGGAPVTAQLILTAASSQAGAGWGPLGLLGLLGLGAAWAGRRRRRWAWWVGAVALAAAGCGGAAAVAPDPPPAAAPATYTLQITATAEGLQASVPVTLTVTP